MIVEKYITIHKIYCDECGNSTYGTEWGKEVAEEKAILLGYISVGENHYCCDCVYKMNQGEIENKVG